LSFLPVGIEHSTTRGGTVRQVRQFTDELADALIQAETFVAGSDGGESEFTPKMFFDEWFRTRGGCYFFLFKKNLKVTNIQLAELVALMRSHFGAEGLDPPKDLQFITSTDFNESTKHLFDAFPAAQDSFESRCREFARIYAPLFRRRVVVDVFFGSCAVFVPPCLSLDLGQICAHSGYIHSCGHNVFTRKAYKTKKDQFFKALVRYLKSNPTPGKRVFFAAYTHEDFTSYDRRWRDELLDGLDNVKIFVEKYYMESASLVSVLREMKTKFADQLVIPEAGNFRETHQKLRKDPSIDNSRTLWLLVDRSTTKDRPRQAGETKYFICYSQLYKNENPFHYFDENKPAWISHTTIPHTLMGAMINITKPWLTRNVSVADPFVGSGTTWLEMLKYPDATCRCGDLEPMTPILASDNLKFFCASADELEPYIQALEFVLRPSTDALFAAPGATKDAGPDYGRSYEWALENLEKLPRMLTIGDGAKAAKGIRDLNHRSLVDRLFLYLALRATVRHSLGLERKPEKRRQEWRVAYCAEAEKLLDEFRALKELREEEGALIEGGDAIVGVLGTYSESRTLNRLRLAKLSDASLTASVKCSDARALRPDSYDIVVTDPPYGFNDAPQDQRSLAAFYASIMETLILALKKRHGQLVFAVPDWSHTGKRLPYFTYRNVITQQVLVAAEKHGREVFHPALSVPAPGALFRPPYYWESERALRRAILHFRIRAADVSKPRTAEDARLTEASAK
jgi:hypothetical protein